MQLSEFVSDVAPAGYPLIGLLDGEKEDDAAFRIVVIGDSFVWGDGCTNRNELFWRLLERDLRERGYNCRVYGVGIGSANAYEEISWLTGSTLVEDLSPDLVIFGYVYNDANPSKQYLSYSEISWSERLPLLYRFGRAFPNIYGRLIERIAAKTIYNQKYGSAFDENAVSVLEGETYAQYETGFVQPLDRFAADADFPVIVMTLPPQPDRITTRELFKPLHKLYAEAEHICFYDSLSALNRFAAPKHAANYRMSPVNAHPGSAVNRFYADYLSELIRSDFSGILPEKSDVAFREPVCINDSMPGTLSLQKTRETQTEISYSFVYPPADEKKETAYHMYRSFLNYPIGQDYIKLCFSTPADIVNIRISCAGARDITLYYTAFRSAFVRIRAQYSIFCVFFQYAFIRTSRI